ncbi:MAG: class I SAM-dependent methyltransferase [Actinomycetota bacterium]
MDEAREKSRAVWNEMAPGWERYRDYMERTSGHVAEWIARSSDPREGDTFLDVAGGPGDLAPLLAERVGQSGKVIETDFAPEMVEVARRLIGKLGLTNVENRVLDAEQMDLQDASVDGITCRWGFMLMLDPAAAMKECRRVLERGRHLALSVWGAPERNPWVTVPGMTLVQLGHAPGGDPLGPGGIFSLGDPERLRAKLEGAGFSDISIEEIEVTWTYENFDTAWAFMTELAGPIARLVKELPPDQTEEVRSALENNFEPFKTGSAFSVPGVTLNARAS